MASKLVAVLLVLCVSSQRTAKGHVANMTGVNTTGVNTTGVNTTSSGNTTGSGTNSSVSTGGSACDQKGIVRKLFSDHSWYTNDYIVAVIGHLPTGPAVSQRLLQNQQQIGQQLGQMFTKIGQQNGQQITKLLTDHITAIDNVLKSAIMQAIQAHPPPPGMAPGMGGPQGQQGQQQGQQGQQQGQQPMQGQQGQQPMQPPPAQGQQGQQGSQQGQQQQQPVQSMQQASQALFTQGDQIADALSKALGLSGQTVKTDFHAHNQHVIQIINLLLGSKFPDYVKEQDADVDMMNKLADEIVDAAGGSGSTQSGSTQPVKSGKGKGGSS
jgi:hypothetical protein